MSSNSKKSKNKKQRKLSPEEEFKLRKSEATTLRNYILQCTDVPSDCPAVRAALTGIDNEIKKIERDEKLRLKFAGTTTTKTTTETAEDEEDMEWQDVGDDVDSPLKKNKEAENDHHHEGEDLTASVVQLPEAPPSRDSPLGRKLASLSIASIADAGVTISHPLAAIAIVLHAALVSDVIGFKCTGIPDEGGSKGFAKPIRELPRSIFIPDKWDSHASGNWSGGSSDASSARVVLRYRKDGVGSAILRVTVADNANNTSLPPTIRVKFGPAGKNNDVQKGPADFCVGDHINLDGLAAALSRNRVGVPPALHYLALSTLLTDFCDAVDLGVIKEEDDEDGEKLQIDDGDDINMAAAASMPHSNVVVPPPAISNDPLRIDPRPVPVHPSSGRYDRHPRIEDFDNPVPHPGGDFAGDLAPGGIMDPRIRPGSGVGGGNLMGPTHPSFRRGPGYYDDGGLDFDTGPNVPGSGPGLGGLGMRPRFDPVYPPGGPADPNGGGMGRGRGRGRGRGGSGRRNLGDPNPDHQRPPSDFGGDMFM